MPKSNIEKKDLETLFIGIMDFLKESNIPIILFYGTLLGYVRDSEFIPGDDDIDVLVSRENFNKLKTFVFKNLNKCPEITTGLVIRDLFQLYYKGIGPFDFYPYEMEGDSILIHWDGQLLYETKNIFPIQSVTWYGLTVYIPFHSEEVLRITYGDTWRIPQKKTDYDWWGITSVKFKD
jgi:hypothetical protein